MNAVAMTDNNGQTLTVSEAEAFNEKFLRDHFATAALQGLCASRSTTHKDDIARNAYAIADSMLKERVR